MRFLEHYFHVSLTFLPKVVSLQVIDDADVVNEPTIERLDFVWEGQTSNFARVLDSQLFHEDQFVGWGFCGEI